MVRPVVHLVLLAACVLAAPVPSQLRRGSTQVHVLVVDHQGKPVAGVPVCAAQQYFHGSTTPGLILHTDEDGRARVGVRSSTGSYENVIRPWFPMNSSVGVKIEPGFQNDADNPIRLQLPVYGMVRVYVVDPDGKPATGVESVTLEKADPFTRSAQSFSAAVTGEDHATFSFVEEGVKLRATCRVQGAVRPEDVFGDGPRHHMDMRILTLAASAPPTASFELVSLEGTPVKGELVGVIFVFGTSLVGVQGRLDLDGRAQVVVPDAFAESEGGVITIVRRGEKGDYLGAARMGFESWKASPDLGSVQLIEEPVLVRGTVVDEEGRPVSGLGLSVPGGYNPGARSRSTSGGSVFFRHSVTTDEEGRFEFRELSDDPGGITITPGLGRFAQRYVVSGADAATGDQEHTIVLGRASSIQGTFAGLSDYLGLGVRIELRDKEGVPDTSNPRRYFSTDTKGVFRLPNCPPGEYSVGFQLNSGQEPFLLVKGIEVLAGEVCEDVRLQGIDLSGHCRRLAVTVLKPDQTPLAGVTVWQVTVRGNGTSASGLTTDGEGKVQFTVPLEGANILVQARNGDYRSQSFENHKENLTVVMQPGIPAKVRFKNMPQLPDNLRFRVSHSLRQGGGNNWGIGFGSSTDLVVGGEAFEMRFAATGVHSLRVNPIGAVGTKTISPRLYTGLAFSVDVSELAEGEENMVVDLEFDDAQLEAIELCMEEVAEAVREASRKK